VSTATIKRILQEKTKNGKPKKDMENKTWKKSATKTVNWGEGKRSRNAGYVGTGKQKFLKGDKSAR